jgi:hypothetical protein
MAIDPRIALGVQPLQLQQPDPNQSLNSLARIMQIGGMMDEQQVNALKVDEYKRGVQEENVLRDMYRNPSFSWNDPTQRSAAFAASPTKAQGHYKAFVDADKARFEMAEKRWGAFKQEVGAHINNPNATPQDVARSVGGMVQAGLLDAKDGQSLLSTMPQDPQGFRGFLQQIVSSRMTPEQLLTVFAPKPEKMDNGQQVSFRDTNPNSPTYGQATAGGVVQKVATPDAVLASDDRRKTREQSERHHRDSQNAPRGQFIETTNGYVLADPKTGAVRPVTGADGQPLKGKAADRQMTDAQAKANLFGSRMKESDRILSSLEGKYSPMAVNAKVGAEKVPLVGGAAGYAANKMLSDAGQQAEQAQRDFINAVLRRESGAVITDPEFDNAKKQYLPQPGDSPAVLTQKRRNRNLAIQGMEAEVPGGFRSGPSLSSPTGSSGGATGDFGGGWKIERVN